MRKSLSLTFSLLMLLFVNLPSQSKVNSGNNYRLLILGLYINGINLGDEIVYQKKKVFM